MQISKKDDQAMATIGRLAGYNPQMAKTVALKMTFEDHALEQEVHAFWKEVHLNNNEPSQLKRQIEQVDVNPQMMHWLNAFVR